MNEFEIRTGVIKPVEIYKEAWGLIKGQYWLVFGIVIVGMLVGSVIPVVLIGPMMCGIFMCLFCLTVGKPLKFEDVFNGFPFIWKSLPISLAIMAPILVFIVVIYIPMIGMAVAGSRMSESEVLPFIVGVLIFEMVFAVIMVCIHTLLMFAFPLVADRGISAFEAIRLSAKAVWRNLAGMAGLLGVGMVVVFVGYLALCVGVYFTIPLIIMAQAVAYRKIFPARPPQFLDPPPPGIYPGV